MTRDTTASLQERARALYQSVGPQVDATVAAQLRQTRRQALAEPAHSAQPMRWMVPAGACAMALVAAMVLWQPLQHGVPLAAITPTVSEGNAANILPPDASQTDPAMYQNLDFYAWLAHQPATSRHENH